MTADRERIRQWLLSFQGGIGCYCLVEWIRTVERCFAACISFDTALIEEREHQGGSYCLFHHSTDFDAYDNGEPFISQLYEL